MANSFGKNPVYDTVASKRKIISGIGATVTLDAIDSGAVVCLDRAGGSVITLPVSADLGITYEFITTVTNTTPSYKIITGVATELLVGQIINCDTDTSDAVATWKSLVATGNVSVTLNGTTTGGIIGDRIVFTKVTSTKWAVNGTTLATGSVATPFGTS